MTALLRQQPASVRRESLRLAGRKLDGEGEIEVLNP